MRWLYLFNRFPQRNAPTDELNTQKDFGNNIYSLMLIPMLYNYNIKSL